MTPRSRGFPTVPPLCEGRRAHTHMHFGALAFLAVALLSFGGEDCPRPHSGVRRHHLVASGVLAPGVLQRRSVTGSRMAGPKSGAGCASEFFSEVPALKVRSTGGPDLGRAAGKKGPDQRSHTSAGRRSEETPRVLSVSSWPTPRRGRRFGDSERPTLSPEFGPPPRRAPSRVDTPPRSQASGRPTLALELGRNRLMSSEFPPHSVRIV